MIGVIDMKKDPDTRHLGKNNGKSWPPHDNILFGYAAKKKVFQYLSVSYEMTSKYYINVHYGFIHL